VAARSPKPPAPPRLYPQRFARLLIAAMHEALGEFSTQTLLASAALPADQPDDTLERTYPFAQLAALNRALLTTYGEAGGRALALEIGGLWFEGMASFGAFAAFADPMFQKLPDATRMQVGLKVLAEIFSRHSDQGCTLETEELVYHFIVLGSPFVYPDAPNPACHLLAGLIAGCVRAATGGRDYPLRESECRAGGAARCVFTISKRAV
jgi:predicted hydrocarbon binding protein